MSQESLKKEIAKIVKIALREDCVFSDVTSDLTIPKNSSIAFEINAREEIIFCGKEVISEVFAQLQNSKKFKNSQLDFKILIKDGGSANSQKTIPPRKRDTKLIFAAERVMLNLIQHLSGVATLTQKFVQTLGNKKIKILDTRKTLPSYRLLQKYAVTVGGGKNHRFSLSDMILIKENNIAEAGGVAKAITACKGSKLKIEVECDTPAQVKEALESKPDIIMLDNMEIADLKKSIKLIGKKGQIEVSGGVNLENIRSFSELEIDFISIGSLTHSVRAVDIGLDVK